MKIYISALPLALGVILQFGVSNSMETPPGNHGHHSLRPQFEYNQETGRLEAIIHNGVRHAINSVIAPEISDNYTFRDTAYLQRVGYHQYTAVFRNNKYKDLRGGCCTRPLSRTVHPRQDDVVVLRGFEPLGIYMNDENGILHFHLLNFPPLEN